MQVTYLDAWAPLSKALWFRQAQPPSLAAL